MMYNMRMREINISEFRQKCLTLMDDVPAEGIVITKHGRPVAKLVPIRQSPAELIGSVPDLLVDNNDDLFSTGIKWDAQS